MVHNYIVLLSMFSIGAPNITDISFYSTLNGQSLTCASVGGPATSVMWMKNGIPLVPKHAQMQEIADFTASTYLNVLLLGQQHPNNINGSYTCVVNNSRGSDKMNFELHGKISLSSTIHFMYNVCLHELSLNLGLQITGHNSDQVLNQGVTAAINCTTNLFVTTIAWLDEEMEVLNNASDSPLTLILAEVTKTQKYTCIITSPFGNQSKTITILVAQPVSSNSSAVVGGTVVAVIILLLLIAAGVVIIVNAIGRLVCFFAFSVCISCSVYIVI